MATIPTYNSQVTQVVPQKEYHVDSTTSAIVKGLTEGINDAAGIASSMAQYQKAIENEEYELNATQRALKTTESSNSLYAANEAIRAELAKNPNYNIANAKLTDKFNEILQNPPELDERSVEEWRKTLLSEYKSMTRNNIKWSSKASATAAKKATEQANLDLYDRIKNGANQAGRERIGYSAGSLDIDSKGQKTEYHVPAMNSKDKAIQEELNSEYFVGMSQVPLQTDEANPAVSGIFENLNAIEGTEDSGWWIFGEKGKTKQEVGEQKITQYFDDVRNNIESSDLPKARKEALVDYATSQENARKREFNAFVRASNIELQKELSNIDITAVPKYFSSLEAQQEQDNLLELNVTPKTTVADELASDYLANLTFGNDYLSPATYFEYAPIGQVKDFNADLQTALKTLNIPVGKWSLSDLYNKYAPNGTINEIQALEALVSMNPNIVLTDNALNQMSAENGFDETDWAYSTMMDIAEMPDSTNEEQQRKQAAINHAIFQSRKEINNGMGFIDKNLDNNFETMLRDNEIGNALVCANPEIIRQINAINKDVQATGDISLAKRASSIVNQGVRNATQQYLQDGDKSVFANNIKKVNQAVLAMRYSGVLDIDDMQAKLENGKPAIFTYNGRPYEYLGFSGQEIYVRIGNKKAKLGE